VKYAYEFTKFLTLLLVLHTFARFFNFCSVLGFSPKQQKLKKRAKVMYFDVLKICGDS